MRELIRAGADVIKVAPPAASSRRATTRTTPSSAQELEVMVAEATAAGLS